jgi:outer membrane protein OmpU
MKKQLLLGTTALIAASVVAGGVAQAAEEPITAGVGGYFRSAVAMISQDDSDGEFANNFNSMALANDIEISVSGSTTLDNGITAGFNAMIEGNGGDALDERHVFFRGSFGQIRIGQTESARQEMTNFAPSGNYNFGVNSPFFIFANPGNAGFFNVRTYDDGLGTEDSLKLIYFSPTFNGFRIGASYAPDDSFNGSYGGNGTNAAQNGGTVTAAGVATAGTAATALQNNSSVAAEFSHNFGDFNLRLMAGYEMYVLERCGVGANTQTCEDTPDSMQFGGTISFGEFSIGGGYLESTQIALNAAGQSRDREDFDLGIAWWSGPIGVGLQYGQADSDQVDGTVDSLTIFELNATYVLGPGIDVGAAIAKGEFDDGTTGAGLDNDYTEFKMSAALNF